MELIYGIIAGVGLYALFSAIADAVTPGVKPDPWDRDYEPWKHWRDEN